MAKNNSILEESKKRFQQILEYVNYANYNTDEAEEPQDGGKMPADDQEPMGGVPQGGEMPQGNNGMNMPADGGIPQDNSGMQQGNANAPEGFNPQGQGEDDMGMPSDDGMGMDNGEVGPDDDVIDITDLTDAQEETDEKIDKTREKFDAKFEKVFDAIKNVEQMISSNDAKINSLKDEFEKRNPTDLEKLEMQSVKSGPFNVKPDEYWKSKENTSNYRIGDNDEKAKFEIRTNDIAGINDWQNISDTLDDDILYHQTMKNTMRI